MEIGLKPGTRRRYRGAVFKFVDWWDANQDREALDDSSYEGLDDGLALYLQHLYDNNGSKSTASCLLHGLYTYLPRAKGHLLLAERMTRNWLKAERSVPYPPLTWSLTCALAHRMTCRFGLSYGVATLLGFDCLLRIGEFCSLLKEDIAHDGDSRLDGNFSGTMVRIASSKTGPDQSVLLDREDVAALVRAYAASRVDSAPLFPFSAATYRLHFKQAAAELGLSDEYVPHSLRHGGCTSFHLRGNSVETCMERGRWASTKSTRRYIQSGRSLLLKMRSPAWVVEFGEKVARNLLMSFLAIAGQGR